VITLAKNGWQVTGVDFVSRAIQIAKRKIQQAGVHANVFQGDVTQLKLPDRSIDLALDIGCYHNLNTSSKQAYEQNLSRFLSPDGYFLLYAFTASPDGTTGITHADLSRLNTFLVMEFRQDGQDRSRPSAWFKFRRNRQASKDL
jgi:ubiquinone/menaquinone biosynthesis C-methylase UbiE